MLVLLFLLLSRFVYLQIAKHSHYQTLAENNRISVVPIVPNRGLILDRNGVILAHNYSGYTLEITPNRVTDLEGYHRSVGATGGYPDQGSQAFQEAAGGKPQLREPADPQPPER